MTTKCIIDDRMPTYSTYVWFLSSFLSFSFDTPSIDKETESLKEPKQDSFFMTMAGGIF